MTAMSLPTGGRAGDREAYHREWDELIRFIESVMPGYRVFAYDPGMMLSHPDVPHKTLSISCHAVLALREGIEGCSNRSA